MPPLTKGMILGQEEGAAQNEKEQEKEAPEQVPFPIDPLRQNDGCLDEKKNHEIGEAFQHGILCSIFP